MFRSFNLFKSNKSVLKINDGIKNTVLTIEHFVNLKDTPKNKINVTKYFFSSNKDNVKDMASQIKIQNPIIKEVIEVQITEKKTKRKSSTKNDKMFIQQMMDQNDLITTLNTESVKQHQQNSQRQKEKKPRKRNKKNKKQKQQVQISSVENKDFNKDFVSQSKTKSFYKILFPQSQYQKQEDKLLMILQKSHEKSKNQHQQNDFLKVQKPKKKKQGQKASKDVKPLFQQKSSNIQIKGLDDLLIQANKDIQFPKIEQFEQNLFYVLNSNKNVKMLVPFGFRYHLYRFCKYQIYLSQFYSEDQMIKYRLKCIDTIRFYCLGKHDGIVEKKIDNNLKLNNTQNSQKTNFQQSQKRCEVPSATIDRLTYMQQFMTNLLPFENTQAFADIYLQVGLQYLKVLKQRMSQPNINPQLLIPSVNSLRMILTNIKRLLFHNCDDFEIDDAKEQDYLLYRAFFTDFLDFFCARKYKFETADKVECVEIAKFLKIPHPQFMQFVKQFVQENLQNFSMVEFLLMLGYLVENKNTPYQYFYKQKGNWMKIIESSHDFSSKKTKCCIKLLEVFSRERFLNCQKIYHKLLQMITNNLQAMEGKQLVRTLYYYSRTRYGSNPIFISNLVDKISRWLPYLQERQFSLLVRSIGNLNYQSAQLVQKLKNINYERFLCQLKYGCENLGSYYKEILKQVQTQSRRKQYFDGQETFDTSSNETQKNNQEDFFVAAEKVF